MNAFAKAFGNKAAAQAVIEGEAQVKEPQSAQDAMAMKLLKMLIPDFDPSVIQKLGTNVENMVSHFNSELAIIKSNQEKILYILQRNENDGR